jgi:hypothetical protein
MSFNTIDNAINNTLFALMSCVNDDPIIQRFIEVIESEFDNIKPVVLDSSLLPIIRNSVSSLYETLDKALIILRHIKSFILYAHINAKDEIKSIDLCLQNLDVQYNLIVATIAEIKLQVQS